MSEFLKDPSAVLDYVFDWSPWLADGETISSKTVTVDDGLDLDSSSVTDTAVTVWLSGGESRTAAYAVACLITTSAGRTDERTMRIRVRNR